MEWNIAFMGPVGAGKTTAITSVSDIDCLDTEVAHYEGSPDCSKLTTTVALDMGVLELGGGDRLRLQGAPGQQRFDYMWDILLLQAQAVVVLIAAGFCMRCYELIEIHSGKRTESAENTENFLR